jgi:hypothetical protein
VTSLTAVSGPRPSRPDGGRQRHGGRPAAAGPQHREGRLGESFLPREECAQRAQGKKVTDRPLRDRGRRATASASRRLIRQQQAAKERWSQAVKGDPWFRRSLPGDHRITSLTRRGPRSRRRKAGSARVIEREERDGGFGGHCEMPRRRGPAPTPDRRETPATGSRLRGIDHPMARDRRDDTPVRHRGNGCGDAFSDRPGTSPARAASTDRPVDRHGDRAG